MGKLGQRPELSERAMQRSGKSVYYERTMNVKAPEQEPTLHNCKKSEQRAEGQEMRSDPDRTDPIELGFL